MFLTIMSRKDRIDRRREAQQEAYEEARREAILSAAEDLYSDLGGIIEINRLTAKIDEDKDGVWVSARLWVQTEEFSDE